MIKVIIKNTLIVAVIIIMSFVFAFYLNQYKDKKYSLLTLPSKGNLTFITNDPYPSVMIDGKLYYHHKDAMIEVGIELAKKIYWYGPPAFPWEHAIPVYTVQRGEVTIPNIGKRKVVYIEYMSHP